MLTSLILCSPVCRDLCILPSGSSRQSFTKGKAYVMSTICRLADLRVPLEINLLLPVIPVVTHRDHVGWWWGNLKRLRARVR